jgi:hypothetical protein
MAAKLLLILRITEKICRTSNVEHWTSNIEHHIERGTTFTCEVLFEVQSAPTAIFFQKLFLPSWVKVERLHSRTTTTRTIQDQSLLTSTATNEGRRCGRRLCWEPVIWRVRCS